MAHDGWLRAEDVVSADPTNCRRALRAANAIIAQQAEELAVLQARITDLQQPYRERDAEFERLLPPHRHPGSTGGWLDRLQALRTGHDDLASALRRARGVSCS